MDGALCGLFWPGSFGQALLDKVLWMVRCVGSFGQALLAKILWDPSYGRCTARALLAKVLWMVHCTGALAKVLGEARPPRPGFRIAA